MAGMGRLPRMLRRLRFRHLRLLPLALTVAASDLLFRLPMRRTVSGKPAPLAWTPGVSVIIPERGSPAMLAECLGKLAGAIARVPEPVEVIVVVNGGDVAEYAPLRAAHPSVRWLSFREALGFSAAVLEGLSLVRHGATYLLNSDMMLEPEALRALLDWREPGIFGIASQILMQGDDGRREETGWIAMAFDRARPMPHHQVPPDGTVRGTVWAGAGAALFDTALLRQLFPECVAYDPFYWEDADLGARAWRMGYESIVCPASIAWHEHRATVRRYYPREEVARIFERNRLQFLLRNPFPRRGLHVTLAALADCESRSIGEIGGVRDCLHLWNVRRRSARMPHRDLDYATMSTRIHSRPRKRRLLLASPFAVMPPSHGSAVRTHRLASELARDFEVILLSDEADLYREPPGGDFAPFGAVHWVRGRPAERGDGDRRIARIESHSHPRFRQALARLVDLHEPCLVMVEHAELAGLIDAARDRTEKWVLSLHDVLLEPDNPASAHADRIERALIDRYDGIVVSSPEDRRLLGTVDSRLVVNGFDESLVERYRPSTGSRSILFVGPFRTLINWQAICAFLEQVYPALESAVPGVSLTVVGGPGALSRTRTHPAFSRPSVTVLEYVDDVSPLMERAAVTINPQQELRGSSLKVVESMAAGRACVSTAAGARGHASAGFRGLLVCPDVAAFVEPLGRLLRDEAYRVSIEAPEREKLAPFTWRAAGDGLRAYLEAVIARA
jgi:GT2 family glycosyltransferase